MLTGSLHLMGRFTLVTPKTATAAKFGSSSNANIDVAALLKKSGATGGAESRIEDTLEITGTHKKTEAPAEENWAKDLANYVSGRNKEIRESIPKPIPAEIVWGFINSDPNKEEIDRQKAMAAKFQPIDTKMKCGKPLSPEEMKFLREYYPDIYMVAIRVQREREILEIQLRNCNTKEEKLQVITQKKLDIASVAQYTPEKDEMGMLFIQCMLAAIDEEVKKVLKERESC